MKNTVDMLRQCATISTALAKRLQDAVVYLDDGAAEAAMASFGTKLQQAAKPALLVQLQAASFQDAKGHKRMTECYILCSVSEDAHALEAGLGSNAYQHFAASVQHALHGDGPLEQQEQEEEQEFKKDRTKRDQVAIAVQYIPLHVCPLTDSAFVLPASSPITAARFGGKLAGYSNSEAQVQGSQMHTATDDGDDDDDGQSKTADLRLLAHNLVGFAAQQNLRLDSFAMGPASRALGVEICALSPPVGPNGAVPSTPASIILIDRQLDIMTPALHQAHVLDHIFGQHKPKHTGIHQGSGRARTAPVVGHSHPTATQGSSPTKFPREASEDSAAEAVQSPAGAVDTEAVKGGWSDAYDDDLDDRGTGPEATVHELPHQQHQRQLPCNRADQIYGLRSADVEVPLISNEAPPGLHGSVLGSGQAREWLQFLLSRQPKDALLYLRKWLKEAARKENIQLKISRSKLTDKAAIAEEVKAWADALMAKPDVMLRQRGIIQLACAAVHALTPESSANWAALETQEQQLLQHALDGTEELANAVIDIFRGLSRKPTSHVELQDALLLMCVAYCLAANHAHAQQEHTPSHGASPWFQDQESAIQEALVDALLLANHSSLSQLAWLEDLPQRIQQHQLRQQQLSPADKDHQEEEERQEGWDEGEPQDHGSSLYHERQQLKAELQQTSERMLVQVRSAAALQARVQNRMQKSGEAHEEAAGEAEKLPLLRHVTRRVVKRQVIPGLHHATASLRGLLKSGLGRFGLQKQPHPADHSVVILFVVGGVSMLELREVHLEIISQQGLGDKLPQILAGGTVLLRPRDLYHNLVSDMQSHL
ncbi:TPA: hypothetical protein ACH3X1_008295 [Trebouxia sp. C0004]